MLYCTVRIVSQVKASPPCFLLVSLLDYIRTMKWRDDKADYEENESLLRNQDHFLDNGQRKNNGQDNENIDRQKQSTPKDKSSGIRDSP